MAPKSRQAQQQARTERAEAGSPASQAHAASAANAAPQGDLHSTREELDPEVLRRAIERGDEAAVEQFHDAGGDVDAVFERGVTPLMLAARHGMFASLMVLLQQADVAAVDADGHTAADFALQGGHFYLAVLLTALQPSDGDGGGEAGGQEEEGQTAEAADGTALEQGASDGADSSQVGVVAVRQAVALAADQLPGLTPLMLAAAHGAVPVLRELLRGARAAAAAQQAGQQAGQQGGGGSGGGGSGSGNSDSSSIRRVVNAATMNGTTALHLAAECRHQAAGAAAARLLIAAGADMEVRSGMRTCTPLTLAASGDNLAVVRVLLEAGADPRARCWAVGADSPLLFASAHASTAVVKALLDAGADPRAREIAGPSALEMALCRGAAEVALLLLAAGAEVTLPRPNGGLRTQLAVEVYHNAMAGHAAADPESVAAVARELVARGVSPNFCLGTGSCNVTMLNVACGMMSTEAPPSLLQPCRRRRGPKPGGGAGVAGVRKKVANVAAIRALLELGASLGACTQHGQSSPTPLHMACTAVNGDEAAAVLLEAGADANGTRVGPMGDRQTPLTFALRCGTLATVELLLTRGKADPNLRVGADTHYGTPLLVACEMRPEAVPLLLAAGADPNLGHVEVKDASQAGSYFVVSPLMLAAMQGHEEVVTTLLEAGADPLLRPNPLAPTDACLQGAAAGRRGPAVGRRSAAGSTVAGAAAVRSTEPAVRTAASPSIIMRASEAKAHFRSLALSERISALLFDAIDQRKGRVSAQQQQQLEQQQQEQRARAEAAAAQLLAEEEAEAERARAKRTTGSKGKKGKGAKGAGEGALGSNGTAASQGSSGVQKEEAAASQVESQSGGIGGRQATEEEAAASAVVEPQAGASSSSSSAAPRVPVVTEAEAAGDAAVGQASVLRGAAASVQVKGQPAPGPKRKGGRAGKGSIPPAPAAVSLLSTPPQLVATTAQLQLPGHNAVAGGHTPSDGRPPSASSLAPSPLPTPSTSAVPLTPLSSPAAVVPTPPSLASMHDDGLCVVCMERRRSTVLVPCSHVVMCQACCDAVREARDECPMCREPIDAVLVIL